MARKKSNKLSPEKQWVKRIVAAEKKARVQQAARVKREAEKNVKRELVASGRLLRRIGIIQTKERISQKTLTKSVAAKVRKAIRETNAMGHYTKGHVERPIKLVRIGKRVKAELAPHFQFIRTKKTPKTKAGIIKTKKGLLVEKENELGRVRIGKAGYLVETDEYTSGGITITREGLNGEEILELVEAIKDGRFKIPKNSVLTMFNFIYGRGNRPFVGQSYPYDDLDRLVDDIERYERTMAPSIFDQWLSLTEITLRQFPTQERRK